MVLGRVGVEIYVGPVDSELVQEACFRELVQGVADGGERDRLSDASSLTTSIQKFRAVSICVESALFFALPHFLRRTRSTSPKNALERDTAQSHGCVGPGLAARFDASVNHGNGGAGIAAKGVFQALGLTVPPSRFVLQRIEGFGDAFDLIIHENLPKAPFGNEPI
jgi:hypothetical protein